MIASKPQVLQGENLGFRVCLHVFNNMHHSNLVGIMNTCLKFEHLRNMLVVQCQNMQPVHMIADCRQTSSPTRGKLRFFGASTCV